MLGRRDACGGDGLDRSRERCRRHQVTVDNEYRAGATLWMQRPLSIARSRTRPLTPHAGSSMPIFDQKNVKKLPKAEQKKPRAIVVDIDETVLDNSPSQAAGIKARKAFSLRRLVRMGRDAKGKGDSQPSIFSITRLRKASRSFTFQTATRSRSRPRIDNLKNAGFNDVLR